MILIAEYQVNATTVAKRLGKRLKNIFQGELIYDSTYLKLVWVNRLHYTGIEAHLLDDTEEAINELKTVFYKAKLPFKFQKDFLLTIKVENCNNTELIENIGFVLNRTTKRWEWQGI